MSTSNAPHLGPVARKRLLKELEEWQQDKQPVPGMKVASADSLAEWKISLTGADSTIFANEKFLLRFRFPSDYPIESPEVIFLHPTPKHEHVYTNGHICLNVLYDGWSPALTVTSICLSILSMLSSATKKGQPIDNDSYVKNCKGRSPKQTRWMFHDDKV